MSLDPTGPGNLHFNGAVDPVEEERARLETDIAVAKARLLAAQHQAAQLDAQTKQTIRGRARGITRHARRARPPARRSGTSGS